MQFDEFFWKICTYQLKWRKRYPNSSLDWLHQPHYVLTIFCLFFIKHAIWRVFYWKICTYQLKWRKRYPNSSLGWLHHPHYVQCTDIGHHHLPTNGYKWWAVLVSKTSMHFTMEPNYLWDELKKSNCFVYVSIFDRKIHTSYFLAI